MNQRKDPDAILRKIQKEGRGKGKLTVFLGAAAGVGKTYSMLQTAHERLVEGIDAVAGLVETHGRVETQALLDGMPLIPPKLVEYKGRLIGELDLDAVLVRHPGLVLVDELAHTNVPGSRHRRRYQDVLEILEAGIDVYTAMNIQHLESLNDVVGQITQIRVRETVPDSIVEAADEVELVDLPVEKLLERLREGKVYAPAQAERAVQNFFRPGNLNALREMALRWTVEHVDRQMRDYMTDHAIAGPWPARERILVAVSPSPVSAGLVRVGRRMATSMSAPWMAVWIETPDMLRLSPSALERVRETLHLAEELEAETLTVRAPSVAQGLLQLARERNATQIVMGKSLRPSWREFVRGSSVDEVLKQSQGIAVHVIPDVAVEAERHPQSRSRASLRLRSAVWRQSIAITIIVAGLTAILLMIGAYLGPVNVALCYLFPVLMAAVAWGEWPSGIAAIEGVLCFDFLFVKPVHRFAVSDTRYFLTFLMFVVTALVTSRISSRLREQVQAVRQRQAQLRTLHDISRQMAAVTDVDRIVGIVIHGVQEILARPCEILLPNAEGRLVVGSGSRSGSESFVNRNEEGVAAWVLSHGESAGRGTETLTGADGLYLPLKVDSQTIGVLAYNPDPSYQHFPSEQKQLLESLADLAAVALGRAHLTKEAERARWLTESDRLYSTIFSSISHELRTPLASIMGEATGMLSNDGLPALTVFRQFLHSIRDQASQMNRLVGNLLNMARLESGKLHLSLDWVDMEDLIRTTIAGHERLLRDYLVDFKKPSAIPLVRADGFFLEQVVVNLLSNAVRHAPPKSIVKIRVWTESGRLVVTVADQGPGVRPEDIAHLFEKFSNVHEASSKREGTGLGLSICKGIVEAHGGDIQAANRDAGGLRITFTLPLSEGPAIVPAGARVEREGETMWCPGQAEPQSTTSPTPTKSSTK